MGKFFVVSTPIGNLDDITVRAIRTILEADIIACEDTRRTGQLVKYLSDNYASFLKITPNAGRKFVSYHNYTEGVRTPELVDAVISGKNLALVTDAGTPLLSDPGFLLVREAVRHGLQITPVPGASALLSALVTSGLPVDRFTFFGYPPEKKAHIHKLLKEITAAPGKNTVTYAFYVSPHKYRSFLTAISEVLGNIRLVIGREYTKKFEEIRQTDVTSALGLPVPAGEITLLFHL